MHQYTLSALARQHYAELQNLGAGGHRPSRDRGTRSSLRERTGWTMVNLGLRLAVQPEASRQPRPAGS
jgi:hypothetical protein